MNIKHLIHLIYKLSSQFSLRTILVVPSVLLIFVAVGLTGYLALRNSQNAVNEVTTQLREEITARIQQHLLAYLKTPHLVNRVNTEAINLGFLKLHDINLLEQYFWHQLQTFEVISGIYLGTAEGGIIAVARYDKDKITIQLTKDLNKGDYYTYSADPHGSRTTLLEIAPNYDATKRPWYRAAAQAGKPVWSEIYSFTYPAGSLGITANQPVYNAAGQLECVLAADFMLVKIGEFLQSLKIGRAGQTFIMERSGLMVASSTTEPPFTRDRQGKEDKRLQASDSSTPLIRASSRYLLEQFGNLNNIAHTHQLNFQIEGHRHFLQVTPLQDRYGLNWLIVVVVPEDDFMQKINANTRLTIVLSIVVALVMALLMGMLISQWVVHPILRLSTAAKALAKGDWNSTVTLTREDELGQLADSFTQMSRQLQESFLTLEQAYTIAEAARQTAEAASRAKSTFLANMSHELRTPLNAIIGYGNLIEEEVEDLECTEIIPSLKKIQASGQLLLAIISDVLDISKIESDKMELNLTEFEVTSLVKSVVSAVQPLLANSNRNQLVVNCSNNVGTLYTDFNKIQQILQNLLNNANKFTHDGRIILTVKHSTTGVYFEIADTGIGIATQHLADIFKPFNQVDNSSTRCYGGAGLGLTLCEHFCQLLGGHITVQSEIEQGSLFTVYCPSKRLTTGQTV